MNRPDRNGGLGISLPSGGSISAFGEPNSLEWKSPEAGVEWALANEECSSGRQQETSLAHVGKLIGSKGKLVCNGRVLEMLLVFRTGGGPIYWLTLRTNLVHEIEDEAFFEDFAASFKLIRWQ